jgi:hypothetical protein
MGQIMFSLEEVKEQIVQGRKLLLAGDESLLLQLPPGDWIGGTIPYFMTEQGGICSRDKIHVTELPPYVLDVAIRVYDEDSISRLYTDTPEKGFSVIIIPAQSQTHLSFALNAPNYQGFAINPLIGWISGVLLEDLGRKTAKVFCGPGAEALEEGAVVMHVSLPRNKVADVGILNIFEQGEGDHITFRTDGFGAREAYINGQKKNLGEYLYENQWDKRLPLVADYCGAMINTSFQEGDEKKPEVKFYAPVFSGLRYRHAKAIEDPLGRFSALMPAESGERILFSCNCILNYLYCELEGKRTEMTGPATFGEIAYQLLNQTMVYLRIIDLPQR